MVSFPSHFRLLDVEEGFWDSYCSVQVNSRSGFTRKIVDTEGQGSGIVKGEPWASGLNFFQGMAKLLENWY